MRPLIHRMRASLWLHHTLFRHQQAQISKAVVGISPAFRAYETRYRRRTRSFRAVVSREYVFERAARSDIVYVGDYHTLRAAQRTFGELVEATLHTGRRVVLALEFIEGRHQEKLDAFLDRRISEKAFRRDIGHEASNPFGLWFGFRPLLELARRHHLQVIAIDRRAQGPHSLERRDRYAADRIAACATPPDRPLVLALVGQFHVAAPHLPQCVTEALGGIRRQQLIVYQNCDGVYWELLRQRRLAATEAVHLRDNEFCLINTSPVTCQESFLDYLESESADDSATEHYRAERFRELTRWIARFVGVNIESALSQVEVPGELDEAAEQAALLVRRACVPARHRQKAGQFYSDCIETALAYFGSKLINPQREVPCAASRERTLGYSLGNALYRSLDAGRISGPYMRALFRNPLEQPKELYLDLLARCEPRAMSRLRRVNKAEAHALV